MEPAVELIVLLVGAAFFAGMIDAIAGGGGLITIPALLAAGVSPVAAIATNKLQSTIGTAGAVIAYGRRGHVDFRRFALPTLASFAGSGLGAFILTRVDSGFLSALLPALLVAMAAYYMLAPKMTDADRAAQAGPLALAGVVMGIGCYDGFFGPGTGSFFTTALVAIFGLGMIRAVAHAKLLNLASNVSALIVLVLGGHVLWLTGLAMALGNAAGAQAGAYFAMRFGAGIARPLLIISSLALTAKLLADPTNPLTAWILG